MKLFKTIFVCVFVTWLAVVGAYAVFLLVSGTPAVLSWAGVALATVPLLAYFVIAFFRRQPGTDRHPVAFSVLSGLGLVVTMAASYRFGDAAGDIHLFAGVTLIAWVLYLRFRSG